MKHSLMLKLLAFYRRLGRWKMRISFLISSEDKIKFQCNICGKNVYAPINIVENREAASCFECGSNRRFRSLIATLAQEIVGDLIPLTEFPNNENVSGVGMSDSDIYAVPLAEKFSYKNTFYHQEPRLDIVNLSDDAFSRSDFLICSDVFEHIPPPVDIGFHNLARLLKSGGLCIFSAPFIEGAPTHEHFPNLYRWRLEGVRGETRLINERPDGGVEIFDNLRFHGGPGATLEMRLFSREDIVLYFKQAGFTEIKIHDESLPKYGIIFGGSDSYVISARKGT